MTDHPDETSFDTARPATDQALTDLELCGHLPSADEPDPRDNPEDATIARAVADIFDALASTMADTALDFDLDETLRASVDMFQRATQRNEQAQKRRQREQADSKVASVGMAGFSRFTTLHCRRE